MTVKTPRELVKTERPGYLSPLEEMERWFEESWEKPFSVMRTLLPDMVRREFETTLPMLDIYEEGNELIVKADMPGIKKEDLEIDLTDNVLTVRGEKKVEKKVEKGKFYRYERRHGTFFRKIELPCEVDAEKIKAHLENGTLEIRLAKSHKAEGKKSDLAMSFCEPRS